MTLHSILCSIGLLAAAATVRANGDPVAFQSALLRSGHPAPRDIADIRIVSERLRIVPRGLSTDVEVRYLLHNFSDRDYDDIDYGFPVDYLGSGPYHYIAHDPISESQQGVGWRDDCIRSVSFSLDGLPLPVHASEEIVTKAAEKYVLREFLDEEEAALSDSLLTARYGDEIIDSRPCESRRWFYTRFSIGRGAFALLEVRYSLANPRTVSLQAVNSIFGQWSNSDSQQFVYDFGPAKHWGDGTIGSFSAEFDPSQLGAEFDPGACMFEGLTLQRDESDACWRCSATNFRPGDAAPLRISWCRPEKRIFEASAIYELPLGELLRRRIDPSEYTIAVQADPDYPAANLSDLNPGTACVVVRGAEAGHPSQTAAAGIANTAGTTDTASAEAGSDSGTGSEGQATLTIRFDRPTEVAGILLFNGYLKTPETWVRNSRIGSMEVCVVRENGGEQRLESEWRSGTWLCRNTPPARFTTEGLWACAEKLTVTPVDEYGMDWYADKTWGMMGSSVKVTEIRFTVQHVIAGTHYDDLCLSEIVLFGNP